MIVCTLLSLLLFCLYQSDYKSFAMYNSTLHSTILLRLIRSCAQVQYLLKVQQLFCFFLTKNRQLKARICRFVGHQFFHEICNFLYRSDRDTRDTNEIWNSKAYVHGLVPTICRLQYIRASLNDTSMHVCQINK